MRHLRRRYREAGRQGSGPAGRARQAHRPPGCRSPRSPGFPVPWHRSQGAPAPVPWPGRPVLPGQPFASAFGLHACGVDQQVQRPETGSIGVASSPASAPRSTPNAAAPCQLTPELSAATAFRTGRRRPRQCVAPVAFHPCPAGRSAEIRRPAVDEGQRYLPYPPPSPRNTCWSLTSGVASWTFCEVLCWWGLSNEVIPTFACRGNEIWFVTWRLVVPIFSPAQLHGVHRLLHWPPLPCDLPRRSRARGSCGSGHRINQTGAGWPPRWSLPPDRTGRPIGLSSRWQARLCSRRKVRARREAWRTFAACRERNGPARRSG